METIPTEHNVTQCLAQFLVDSQWESIPPPVRHEARRAILNNIGCALGSCRDDVTGRALGVLDTFSGPREATVIGRSERLDVLSAAYINAVSSNLLDFDDTHLRTVIHPTAPVAPALPAMSKSINIGSAARNGMIAAFLAERDFDAAASAIEGRFGFTQVMGEKPNLAEITQRLGETWELTQNAYKPYPTGVVLHPVIDACLELRSRHSIAPGRIA